MAKPVSRRSDEIKPPFSPEGVVTEFADVLARYKITKITGDRYAGEWPRAWRG